MTSRRAILFLVALTTLLAFSYLAPAGERDPLNAALTWFGLREAASARMAVRTFDDVERTIDFWQTRTAQNPRDLVGFTKLGEAFILKARHTGDVAYYQRAETALRQALLVVPGYTPAQSHLSAALLAQHQFAEALSLAQATYAADPRALLALATIGDAQLALGQVSEAEATYHALAEQISAPAVYGRLAQVDLLRGRPAQAIRRMQQALEGAQKFGGEQEELAWYAFQLGELYFNTGQLEAAEQHYQTALDLFPQYHLALAGLGKARAAMGDYEAAITFYRQATAIIPQPDLLAALGDVYSLAGHPEQAQQQYETVEVIGQLAEIKQQLYNRQLANFYSDHDRHLAKALHLATVELELRRDIYGYDAAAWANYKNGRFDQAQALIEPAMQWGTRDAKLFYHAGLIAQAQGRTAEAERLLSEALAINPYFDPLQAPIAQATLDQLRLND